MKDYAIINAEGMKLLVNLDQQDAEGIMQSGEYPPAGNDPGVCYAVPMYVAEMTHRLWLDYEAEAERRLRQARKDRVYGLLKGFDTDYTKV